MTNPTTRRAFPAAPRTPGPWAAALPRDEGLDRLIADPQLGSTAKAVAIALVKHWAWRRDHCWPADTTIAARVGRSPGHIQRCLRELEQTGWIRRERTSDNRTGRRIVLLWRREPGSGAQPDPAPAREVAPAPARDKEIVSSKPVTEPQSKAGSTTMTMGTQHQKPVGGAPSPSPSRPVAEAARSAGQSKSLMSRARWLGRQDLASLVAETSDPILAAELLRLSAPRPAAEASPWGQPAAALVPRLPGRHDLVLPTARALCVAVRDEKAATLRACTAMARAVAGREVPAEVLGDCLKQALGPMAREAGKVLVASWKRSSGGQR
jgi:hypothetical protein